MYQSRCLTCFIQHDDTSRVPDTRLKNPLTQIKVTKGYKSLSSAVSFKIKQGAVQIVWYECVITKMTTPAIQTISGLSTSTGRVLGKMTDESQALHENLLTTLFAQDHLARTIGWVDP